MEKRQQKAGYTSLTNLQKATQLCLQYLMPKPTPEREDKNIVQHFEVEIMDSLQDQ